MNKQGKASTWVIVIIIIILFFYLILISGYESSGSENSEITSNTINERYYNKKCYQGYLDEYKCDGNEVKVKYQRSDCSYSWFHYDSCYYGCKYGECIEYHKRDYKKYDRDYDRYDKYDRRYFWDDDRYYWEDDKEYDKTYYKKDRDREKCDWGYTGEKRCDGKTIQKKWIRLDCESTWHDYLKCEYDCENAKCIKDPTQDYKDFQDYPICSYNAYGCKDFKNKAEAQYVFEKCGGTNNDVHWLDADKDGLACEMLP